MTARAFKLLSEEVAEYETGSRVGSTALLAWYLVNVYRLEPEDVDDAICDGPGDKGIDALVVDESEGEIAILQGKWRTAANRTQGDVELKQLVGAAGYFESVEALDTLMESSPNPELARLIVRQDVRAKLAEGTHTIRLVFVTNGELDRSGFDYRDARRKQVPPLDVWDRARLAEVAERVRRPALRPEKITLTAGAAPTHLQLTENERLAVAVVPASQLVDLPGITDLTLFSRNVRLYAGQTRINRQLRESIRDLDEHRLFPAFHNGLTILTNGLKVEGNDLILNHVGVVNGCQSLVTLHANRDALTADLQLLVKVVEVSGPTGVSDEITYRSNNQNSVTLRDQRSSDPVMRDLQLAVKGAFGTAFGLQTRVGETIRAAKVLDNALAAQLLMAVYVKEPWSAVRKVRLFDEDYRRIFNRFVTPHRLFLVDMLDEVVRASRAGLNDELKAAFASVRFTLNYLVASVVRLSPAGEALFESPKDFLPDKEDEVRQALTELATEVVDTVNFYVSERQDADELFDAKVAFKSKSGVLGIQHEVERDARRQARRDAAFLFDIGPKARAISRSAGRAAKAPAKRLMKSPTKKSTPKKVARRGEGKMGS